jgi:hypothetical protein
LHGCISIKYNTATTEYKCKLKYQYNGFTRQNKHDNYRISNVFFFLDALLFYVHSFILLRVRRERDNRNIVRYQLCTITVYYGFVVNVFPDRETKNSEKFSGKRIFPRIFSQKIILENFTSLVVMAVQRRF